MPILSVFAPLLKSRFFGFYVNGVTLADGMGHKLQSPPFCAIIWGESEGILYEKDIIRLPWEDLTQERHTKLYNAIPPFATG